jgi:hypothetical protein
MSSMRRVLVISYSQSGEVARVVAAFVQALQRSGAELTFAAIRPGADYPYPWRSVRRFFDVMPECLLSRPPPSAAPGIDPVARFDLVVLAYPVWFLSPALPVQGFLRSADVQVLRERDVITISVSRAMWQQASEATKQLLGRAGAVHVDNLVVTHAGSSIATLISTPRALLFGKRDRLLGLFPAAGISECDFRRVSHLGAVVARKLGSDRLHGESFLRGEAAVSISKWFIVPELLARHVFYAWAVIISGLGRASCRLRAAGVFGFAAFLVVLIVVGLPLTVLGTWIAYPVLRYWIDGYTRKLAAPTGMRSANE